MKKALTIIVELLAAVVVLCLFGLLMVKYFAPELSYQSKIDNRFVKVDYQVLAAEANAIKILPPSGETAKNIPILTYHVITKGEPQDAYEISFDQFKANMFALKAAGYQTITIEELHSFIAREKDLPDKSFLLTFDDGSRMGFRNADPILRSLNFTAVMFIITGQSLSNSSDAKSVYYLNSEELQTMEQTGRWQIESHTHALHYRLPIDSEGTLAPALTNKLWLPLAQRIETNEEYAARVIDDLQTSKSMIEMNFNKPVLAFALPFGDFGERASNYPGAHKLLYNLTTQMYPLVLYEFPLKIKDFRANYNDAEGDRFILSRLAADSIRTPDSLLKKVDASRAISLPYVEHFDSSDRWVRLTGTASFENDSIRLNYESPDNYSTIMTYLDGSYLWKDYQYSLQLKDSYPANILLMSRFRSTTEYVGCRYIPRHVQLIRVTEESTKRLRDVDVVEHLGAGTNLSMTVSGQNVECLLNGKKIVQEFIPDVGSYGGVGLKVEKLDAQTDNFSYGSIVVEKIGDSNNNAVSTRPINDNSESYAISGANTTGV